MGATISRSRNSEFVENEINNVKTTVIRITEDKLRLKIADYERNILHSSDWIGAVGLVISIALSLLTAKFEDKIGVTAETWSFIFTLLLIASFIYLICTVIKAIKRKSINDFVMDLKR